MLSLFTYWCSGVLLLGFSSFIPETPAPDASQIDRVVIQSVRLLRPSGSGLVASDPVDVLIENGRVARVDQELIGLLKPGQMALRGRDLWMLPAPRLLLPGKTLAPSDLVVAGVLGIGTVGAVSDGQSHQHLLSRAQLDEIGLPLLEEVSSKDERGSRFELTAPSMAQARLPSDQASVEDFLNAIDQRHVDPFMVGSPARFLVLKSDPREQPSSLADPFAVVQGSELILKSQRLVLLEEYAAFLALQPPVANKLNWPSGPSDTRLYTLIIRGLPRGYLLVASWKGPDGSSAVRVAERIAAPLKEDFEATVHWPSGEVDCSWKVQARSFKMHTTSTSDGSGKELHIALNGVPIQEQPITLKPGDQFLPHSMLIAFDALHDPSSGATSRLVEVDVMGAPVRIDWSTRIPFKSGSGDLNAGPLNETQIRALGGSGGGHVRVRSITSSEAEGSSNQLPESEVLLLDDQPWPRLMILSTPWGIVEWVSEPSAPLLQQISQ